MKRVASGDSLVIAVPDLETYETHTGIGRVFQSIRAHWSDRVYLVNATFAAHHLPILRNDPFGVHAPTDARIVFLPRLTGAQALRDTCGIPSVINIHDIGIVDFPGDRTGINWITYGSIMRSFRAIQHATHIITISRFSRDRLVQYLPIVADRISVIPCGIDEAFLDYHRSQAEAHASVEHLVGHLLSGPLLLNVGSEIPRKNVALLLQVFRRIKQYYPNAQLLKVGRPGQSRWRENTIRSMRNLGLQKGKDVLFLEDIDDMILADLYCAADVFVSTSLYEGFGLPALEAMAVGTPVVVTTCGSYPEVVQDVGWTVTPELEAFVQAIVTVIADPRREERAMKSRAHAARFSWSRAAERYLEVMQEACRCPAGQKDDYR